MKHPRLFATGIAAVMMIGSVTTVFAADTNSMTEAAKQKMIPGTRKEAEDIDMSGLTLPEGFVPFDKEHVPDGTMAPENGELQPFSEGERSELPEGEKPEMKEGERPELPEGEKPEMKEGERPELPEGEKPEMKEGERPELPEGEKPEMKEGERPELPAKMDFRFGENRNAAAENGESPARLEK